MNVSIRPGRPGGTVAAPPSKSMAHRLLICAGLSRGTSHISGVDLNEDILATIDCLRALGAKCTVNGDTVTVQEELDHVYDYLAMLSFRFEDRYFVDLHIDKGLLPLYLPRLVLQPLVENAFTHGVRSMASGGRVCITGTLEEATSAVCFV